MFGKTAVCTIVVHRRTEVVAVGTMGLPSSSIAGFVVTNDCCSSWANRVGPKIKFGSSETVVRGYGWIRVPWEEAVQCNFGMLQ